MRASLLRWFLYAFFRIFYRMEVEGLHHLTSAGPKAVIVPNHVSFLDPGLVRALLPRDPVFAIDREMARLSWVKPFLRFGRTVALDCVAPPRQEIDGAGSRGHFLVEDAVSKPLRATDLGRFVCQADLKRTEAAQQFRQAWLTMCRNSDAAECADFWRDSRSRSSQRARELDCSSQWGDHVRPSVRIV